MTTNAHRSFRQIHIDFHTGPAIPAVGDLFDAEQFADTLAASKVDSVTLFAKCHHGHIYHETKSPARHPSLSRSLLEEQIAALRARNIRTPIYLSVQCDEFAANSHPEWIAVNPDGTHVGRKPLSNEFFSWQILDMASPYLDYLGDQIVEVLERFCPLDGLFLDMCWDQPSVSIWAKERMKAWNLDPESAEDRANYARRISHHYMEHYTALVAKWQKDVPIWFNSRPLIRLREEARLLQHIEVEALPTGQWGYAYLPMHIRYAKTLGLPLIGMTGRFHKSWADFGGLRTTPSLLYDCAQALAHGAGCSIGDQLHPSGRLDKPVYEIIGSVYRHVEKCEPWVKEAQFPKEIAVLYCDPATHVLADLVHEGVMRALTQLHYQFVFVPPDDQWEDYPIVIIPETIERSAALEARLSAYRENGGSVLSEDLLGEPSPFSCTYLRFEADARGKLPAIDHAFYEQGVRLEAAKSDEVLAEIVEPYFERNWQHFCSHAQTPAKLDASGYTAALVRGKQAVFAVPVFRAYAKHANLPCRQLISAALARLLPEPCIKVDGPSYLDAVVADQSARRIVHLLSFIPQKRAATMEMVEEAVPARNLYFDLKVDFSVRRISLQPEDLDISFTASEGRVHFLLDWMEGHQMIVAEA